MSGPGIRATLHLLVAEKVLLKEFVCVSLSDGDTWKHTGMEADLSFSGEVEFQYLLPS